MLKEAKPTRQILGEPFRKWYTDHEMDLIIWMSDEFEAIGFQICYQSTAGQKALTWDKQKGFTHSGIDDGESRPGRPKMTPILVADGKVDVIALKERFRRLSRDLPPHIVDLVVQKLEELGKK